MKVFEVGVYNKIVREIIRSGRDLPSTNNISPEFENTLYFERFADDEPDARRRVSYEYPRKLGYVIAFVKLVRD